jgi:beta-glucosidase
MLIGLPGADESEGFDRTHMRLPANQRAALKAVSDANPDVVVVLVNGATVELGEVTPHARALVEAWLGGQAAGGAIADVLSGAVNPSGRLAETVPHRLEDNSSYLNFPGDSRVVRYGEGLYIGYRGYDATGTDVAFPFGYGLSYTTFALSDLAVTTSGSVETGDLTAEVTVTVANTGAVAGAEVVQVYVRDVEASVGRPVRELKGFAKVSLEPGGSTEVTITLDQRAFSFWSELLARWVVEAGEFAIEVGPHSRDLPLSNTVTVDAPSIAPPLTADSTLHEWMADPVGLGLIKEAVAAGQPDPTRDAELVAVIGTMPMSTLAAFPGMSIDHDTLDKLTERRREQH